jgi:lipopolysaccharide/colanic/teichoic acid biosynthesis glycosyltransferase
MIHRPRISDREIIGRDPEVTRVGYWLRRFKIDELPQLVNVLKGNMSLVGPRPALPDQLVVYDNVAMKRLIVRPGLTGLAQVNGNIHLSWPERWCYDAEYVEYLSFKLDIGIIYRTIAVVVFGENRFSKVLVAESQAKEPEQRFSR